jgi:hypothetical protein
MAGALVAGSFDAVGVVPGALDDPGHARVWRDGAGLIGPISGRVEYVEMPGRETMVGVAVADGTRLVVDADPDFKPRPADTISFGIEQGRIYLFDSKTEKALGRI